MMINWLKFGYVSTIDNGLVQFERVKLEQFQKIGNLNQTMKPFKLNRYKKFKLKLNGFREFQAFKPLNPWFRHSVLVVNLGQNSKFYLLI